MLPLDNLSEAATRALVDHGLSPDEMSVALQLDLDFDGNFGESWLIPGVKGYTENITVVSIVGRFLEHSRIYRFGTKEREKVYIASADFMTRNTVRRVEVAAPVLDEKLKERLD